MRLTEYAKRLLTLAETVHRWMASLSALDSGSRDRIAKYADEIAATLARTASVLGRLETAPADETLRLEALREFGRINGYIETLVGVLQHHLDGRKLAGVKRRLDVLTPDVVAFDDGRIPDPGSVGTSKRKLIGHLVSAEGYFRAVADGLRA